MTYDGVTVEFLELVLNRPLSKNGAAFVKHLLHIVKSVFLSITPNNLPGPNTLHNTIIRIHENDALQFSSQLQHSYKLYL